MRGWTIPTPELLLRPDDEGFADNVAALFLDKERYNCFVVLRDIGVNAVEYVRMCGSDHLAFDRCHPDGGEVRVPLRDVLGILARAIGAGRQEDAL